MTTRTGGLIYAVTRHATSRAGDPNPHDHVLVANFVRMADKGGWKGAHTALLREHLHPATMFGRVAAAHEAVRLGYGIERDDGPSGRLGHWRIAGIPDEVIEGHSKRTAEIEGEMDPGLHLMAGQGHRGPQHPSPQAPRARRRPHGPMAERDRIGGLEHRSDAASGVRAPAPASATGAPE